MKSFWTNPRLTSRDLSHLWPPQLLNASGKMVLAAAAKVEQKIRMMNTGGKLKMRHCKTDCLTDPIMHTETE